MRISNITITGADDKVNPKDLIEISNHFCVEWGILFSPTRNKNGEPRYPTIKWVNGLMDALGSARMMLSAHVCGGYTKELLETGKLKSLYSDLGAIVLNFDRIQLNFNSSKHTVSEKFYDFIVNSGRELILQYNKANYEVNKTVIEKCSENFDNIHFLYDSSGGRGILPEKYSGRVQGKHKEHFTGYSGGLSPDNLEEALSKISEAVGDGNLWIDAETGVRTNDELDLDKVIRFLEIAKPYTGGGWSTHDDKDFDKSKFLKAKL